MCRRFNSAPSHHLQNTNVSATVTIDKTRVHVTLDKRAHNPFLIASGLSNQPVLMPWFGNKQLVIDFA